MQGLARRESQGLEADAAAVLRAAAEPLAPVDDADFARPFDRYGDARLVLIGEASHGTSEFYRARAAITRRLITEHGFNIVAVEADWPDAARLDRYLRRRPPLPEEEPAFVRFPSWMWRNLEVRDFIDWLAGYNAAQESARQVEFRGLDVYSLRSSVAAVLAYLGRVDPEAAAAARKRYGCLSPWQAEPSAYGRSVLRGLESCEGAVVAQLRELLERRLRYAARENGEDFFDAAQNARIVRAAEQYYRIMYHGSTESWNLRDRHMFETLQRLLERRGPQARAVVWAHNSHLGNAAATSMGWAGEFNIGELVRKAWRTQAVLIGQGTDRGTVMAAEDWDEPRQVMTVRPSRHDSWERRFVDAGQPRSLTDWRRDGDDELLQLLAGSHLERAIGVIYRPHTERQSHYFDAVLAEQFDAWIWFETSEAVTPLGPEHLPDELPETYPFGL